MKIRSIVIEMYDVDEGDATQAVFNDGKWTFNGSVYGRIIVALHDVWKRLREEVKEEKKNSKKDPFCVWCGNPTQDGRLIVNPVCPIHGLQRKGNSKISLEETPVNPANRLV